MTNSLSKRRHSREQKITPASSKFKDHRNKKINGKRKCMVNPENQNNFLEKQ